MVVIPRMKLAEWLKSTKTRRFLFAERVGVSPSMITDYCKGRSWPRREIIHAIERETGGQVTANDLLAHETAE
jgi:DNA-binding transcriptional regulator YdaS (Cro superfamily)